MPEWVTVLRQFQNVKAVSFLLVAWFMGFGIGLIFTFLFWHLQVTSIRFSLLKRFSCFLTQLKYVDYERLYLRRTSADRLRCSAWRQ